MGKNIRKVTTINLEVSAMVDATTEMVSLLKKMWKKMLKVNLTNIVAIRKINLLTSFTKKFTNKNNLAI